MRRAFGVAMAIIAVCLAGCAGMQAGPIADAATDDRDEGFRYYETSPFLLLYTDGKGGLKSELLFLPDTTKLRSIKPYAWGASNKTTLTFDNGRLVKATSEIDETVIPKAVISGLEKIATSAVKAANGTNEGIPGPYLFRIIKDGQGEWSLAGGIALKPDESGPSVIQYKKQ